MPTYRRSAAVTGTPVLAWRSRTTACPLLPGAAPDSGAPAPLPPSAPGSAFSQTDGRLLGATRATNTRRPAGLTLLFCLVGPLFLASCASAPPDRVAYRTIDDVVTTVQAGMKAFNVLYQSGKFTEQDRDKALDYYAKFQAGARLAEQVARGAAENREAKALAIADAAAEPLLEFLARMGVQ